MLLPKINQFSKSDETTQRTQNVHILCCHSCLLADHNGCRTKITLVDNKIFTNLIYLIKIIYGKNLIQMSVRFSFDVNNKT